MIKYKVEDDRNTVGLALVEVMAFHPSNYRSIIKSVYGFFSPIDRRQACSERVKSITFHRKKDDFVVVAYDEGRAINTTLIIKR